MHYDEVMQIIELMYVGHVDVPKKNWSKFMAAAKLLKINGFEKIGDINPYTIAKEYEMRNCFVKLTDVGKTVAANRPPDNAVQNTPPNSTPSTPTTPPCEMSSTPNTSSDEMPCTSQSTLSAVPGTSKTPSNDDNGRFKTPPNAGPFSANTPPNSVPSTTNSRAHSPEFDMIDLEESRAESVVHTRPTKRFSFGNKKAVPLKKNRRRIASSTNDSSDSDAPLVKLGN